MLVNIDVNKIREMVTNRCHEYKIPGSAIEPLVFVIVNHWSRHENLDYWRHRMENIKIEATQVPDSFIIALFGKQKCDFSTAHKEKISEALNLLPPRHRYVITKRFGFFGLEAQDLMKVAKEFSVTRERIRQLEFRTLDKMRHSLGIQIDV